MARELQIEEGPSRSLRFRRQLLADAEPMSVDENFIPAQRVPGILDEGPPSSLYNVLSERYGLIMEWGEDTIEATAAQPSDRPVADVDIGITAAEDPAPCLRVQDHGGLLDLVLQGGPLQALGAAATAWRRAPRSYNVKVLGAPAGVVGGGQISADAGLRRVSRSGDSAQACGWGPQSDIRGHVPRLHGCLAAD